MNILEKLKTSYTGLSNWTEKGHQCISVLTKCHKLGALKPQKSILSQFWRQVLKVKVSAGPCSPCRPWGRIFPGFFWLLAVANNPWGYLVCRFITPISLPISHGLLPSVSLCLCFSLSDTGDWI